MGSNKKDKPRSITQTLPCVIYHGTCLGYVDETVKKEGDYSNQTYLTSSAANAMSYAVKRADFYKDWPAMLVVDTKRITPSFAPCWHEGQWVSPALNLDSFLILPARLSRSGQYDVSAWLKRSTSWSDKILHLSTVEIVRHNRLVMASRLYNVFGKRSN